MKYKRLPSEGLKLIACLTMLLDHIGYGMFPSMGLRLIGRIAFPIYCFLLAEGVHYTGNPKKYGIRLALAMVLSEIPFDLYFYGKLTWSHQNVLLTLLLGFGALLLMKQMQSGWGKLLAVVPFFLLAELVNCDYGGQGILMIVLFSLARENDWDLPAVALGLLIVSLVHPSFPVSILGISIPIELFSLLALIPISLYSGKKTTDSHLVQWMFYLFYPVHLAILALA